MKTYHGELLVASSQMMIVTMALMILLFLQLATVQANNVRDFEWDIEMLNTTFNPDLQSSNFHVVSAIYGIPRPRFGKTCIPRLHTFDCLGVSGEMSLSSIDYPEDGILTFDVGFDKDRIEGSPFYEAHADGITFDIHFCTRVDCYHKNTTSMNFFETKYTLTVDPLADFLTNADVLRTMDDKNESYSFGTVEAYFCDEHGIYIDPPELERGQAVGYCVQDDENGVYYLHDVTSTTIAQYFEEEDDQNSTTRYLQQGQANGTENIFEDDSVPSNYKGKVKPDPKPLKPMKDERDNNGRTVPDKMATKDCEKERGADKQGKGKGKCVLKVQIPSRFYSNIDIPGEAPVLIYGDALLRLGSGSSRHLMKLPVGNGSRRRLQGRNGGFDLAFSLIRKEEDKDEAIDDNDTNSLPLYVEVLVAVFVLLALVCCCCCVGWCIRSRKLEKKEVPGPCGMKLDQKESSHEPDSSQGLGHGPSLKNICERENVSTECRACLMQTVQSDLAKPQQCEEKSNKNTFQRRPPPRSKSADDALLITSSMALELSGLGSDDDHLDLENGLSSALSKRLQANAKTKPTRRLPGRSKSDEIALEKLATESAWWQGPACDSQQHHENGEGFFERNWFEQQTLTKQRKREKERKTPTRSKSLDQDLFLMTREVSTILPKVGLASEAASCKDDCADTILERSAPQHSRNADDCFLVDCEPPLNDNGELEGDHGSIFEKNDNDCITKGEIVSEIMLPSPPITSSSWHKPVIHRQNSYHNPAA